MTDWAAKCDWQARLFVNGAIYNPRSGRSEPQNGAWSVHFRGFPLVQQAESEGWGRDLRMLIVGEVRRRIMAGEDYRDAVHLLPAPDGEWVSYHRKQAVLARAAEVFREERMAATTAHAPKDDKADKGWMNAGHAVTRAAEAGFPEAGTIEEGQ